MIKFRFLPNRKGTIQKPNLERRTVVASPGVGMPLWQDRLFIWMVRNAADPIDFFHIPAGRVVEMGSQVVV